MAKIVFSTAKAEPSELAYKNVAIIFDGTRPYPSKFAEVKNVAEAKTAFAAYKLEAGNATDEMMVAFVAVAKGSRSPSGFKKAFDSYDVINGKEG